VVVVVLLLAARPVDDGMELRCEGEFIRRFTRIVISLSLIDGWKRRGKVR